MCVSNKCILLFYVTDEVKYKVSSAMKINGLGAKRLIGL